MRDTLSDSLTARIHAAFLLLTAGLLLFANIALAADKAKFDYLSLNRSVAYLDEEITVSYVIEIPLQHRDKKARMQFFLDKKAVGEQELSGFDAAGSLKSDFKFKAAPQGRFQLRAILKIDGVKGSQVEEQRKLAILSLPGGVTSEKAGEAGTKPDDQDPLPDMTPVKLEVDNPSPVSGEKINIRTTLANNGTARATDVKLRIYVDGLPLGNDINVSLDPGKQTTIKTPYTPTRVGQKDILVMVNPDSEVKESSGRNNIISQVLIVRDKKSTSTSSGVNKPRTVTKKAEPKESVKTSTADKKQESAAKKAKPELRLTAYIETINGIHYTEDGRLHVFISNLNQADKTPPFTIGIREKHVSASKSWLAKEKVTQPIAPGTTRRIAIKWPSKYAGGDQVFVAVADIASQSDKSPNIDLQTRPFRVVAINRNAPIAVAAKPEPAPIPAPAPTAKEKKTTVVAGLPAAEIIITQPREKEVLQADSKATIRWKTLGKIGGRVKIAILDTRTGKKMLSTTTNNDGAFNADLSSLPTARYTLMISAENGSAKARKTRFTVRQKDQVEQVSVTSPRPGGAWRGKQIMPIKWNKPEINPDKVYYNFNLVDEQTGEQQRVNINPVSASFGQYNWTVPDDGTLFGRYKLEVLATDGTTVAVVNGLEILPSFVAYDKVNLDPNKPNSINVDLGVYDPGFEGPHFQFTVRNNGPYELGAGMTIGYSFTTYFVRHVPIRSRDDLVICKSNLLARLPVGTEARVWLGKDPDCAVGSRSYDEKFVYAVTRLSLPNSIDINFTGDKKINNMVRYYW